MLGHEEIRAMITALGTGIAKDDLRRGMVLTTPYCVGVAVRLLKVELPTVPLV